MYERGSIFLDFSLPNATTWFYFAALLAVALFFKFSRFFSVRNLDVVTIFLVVPGLLLLHEGHTQGAAITAGRVGVAVSAVGPVGGLDALTGVAAAGAPSPLQPSRSVWFAYLWLLLSSLYLLARCLFDLALVRRPALSPNMNLSGLACLSGSLLVFLGAVAVRQPPEAAEKIGKAGPALDQAKRRAEDLLSQQTNGLPSAYVRFYVERGLAMVCHLAVVIGLVVIGARHFQDATSGMAAATMYLIMPVTAYHIGQAHHVLPVAFIVWAVVLYKLPLWSGAFLGLAAGTASFPVLLFPTWCGFYWRRGAGRFSAGFGLAGALCLALLGVILWAEGNFHETVRTAFSMSDWQPWKVPTSEGFWLGPDGGGLHWAYRIPVFILYLAFVLATGFWPAPKNLGHVLALSAAVLIGIQFWHADQGGVYILWYLPLVLLMMFRPNLSDRRPLLPGPRPSWVLSLFRRVGGFLYRRLKRPEPAHPVV